MDTQSETTPLPTANGLRAKITRVETIPLRIPLKSLHKIAAGPARARAEAHDVRLALRRIEQVLVDAAGSRH